MGEQSDSGAVYRVCIPGEEERWMNTPYAPCNFIYSRFPSACRECFVSTDDSQATRTFLKALNKVLSADHRCSLCDASLGKEGFLLCCVH